MTLIRSLSSTTLILLAALALAPACNGSTDAPTGAESATPALERRGTIERVGRFDAGRDGGTEVVSVQQGTARALLTDSVRGTVLVLSLADPARPTMTAELDLALAAGEELTSVAFHPTEDWFVAAVRAADPFAPGRLEVRDGTAGTTLATVPIGVWPDAVALSPDGVYAVVACEAEGRIYDKANRTVRNAPGSIAVVDLTDGPSSPTVRVLPLTDQTGTPGFVQADHRRDIDRKVDIDGDGRIADEIDWNGDGRITDHDFELGQFDGRAIEGNEEDGEEITVPLTANTPDQLEPEGVAFGPDGRTAFVTLQENNGLAIVDVQAGRVTGYVGLGITSHPADTQKDGQVRFDDTLVALREPDGIALTASGLYLVTADEGDTGPKAAKVKGGRPAGGGRTVSVFRVDDGSFVGDTGNGLDVAAHELGLYPDKRSGHKGSEPEMVVAFDLGGVDHAAVTLERAGVVALISLADPTAPRVVAAAPCADGEASFESKPEGFAKFVAPDGSLYLLCANEGDGTVSVFVVR